MSRKIESMTYDEACAYMARRRGPTSADPTWARRVAVRWRALAVVLAALAIGAILGAILSSCASSDQAVRAAPGGNELPAADTPVIVVGAIVGAGGFDLSLLGGPVTSRVAYLAINPSSGEQRDVDAGTVLEDGWAHCVVMTLRADLRPVVLRGAATVLGDALALWIAALLPRIDLEVSGPVAAIPDAAMSMCEARAGRLRVLALGVDLTNALPSRQPAPAIATEQAPD